jgi:hypothetical protein
MRLDHKRSIKDVAEAARPAAAAVRADLLEREKAVPGVTDVPSLIGIEPD